MTSDNVIETERLVLRAWRDSDAGELFRWASDPFIGPAAGWAPHESVEESRRVIEETLAVPETYAICLKENGQLIGTVSLMFGEATGVEPPLPEDEAELGYWLGRPFWGHGYMTEAAAALLEHGFLDLGLIAVWGRHYVDNYESRRVMERLGMELDHTTLYVERPGTGEVVAEDARVIEREDWLARHGR